MIAATFILALAASPSECAPTEGTHVIVDERFAHVTIERFTRVYFSEAFNNAAAPVMGIKSRLLVDDRPAKNGARLRRVRMQPEVSLPGPLQVFGNEDDVRYDEVSAYDDAARSIRFYIDNKACDRLKYGGVIHFVPDGDGVRLHIDAVLQVDAPIVGGIVEGMVRGGVRDSYAKLGAFMQSWLDKDALSEVATRR